MLTVQQIFIHCLIIIFLSTDTREMFEFSELKRHECWENLFDTMKEKMILSVFILQTCGLSLFCVYKFTNQSFKIDTVYNEM